MIAQFENFGMHIVEDNSRKPDMRLYAYVGYIPEWGLFVHRTVSVGLFMRDRDETLILHVWQGHVNINGLLDAAFTSRDDMVTGVARQAVQTIVKELQKGTKGASAPAAEPKAPTATAAPTS